MECWARCVKETVKRGKHVLLQRTNTFCMHATAPTPVFGCVMAQVKAEDVHRLMEDNAEAKAYQVSQSHNYKSLLVCLVCARPCLSTHAHP